ncbi:hypothetical protein Tco_0210562 [Tanacetum coccineum]
MVVPIDLSIKHKRISKQVSKESPSAAVDGGGGAGDEGGSVVVSGEDGGSGGEGVVMVVKLWWAAIEPDAPVIDNFNELNKDQRGSEIIFLQNVEDDDSFTFIIRTFLPFLTYPEASPLSCSTGSEDTIFDPGIIPFPSRADGIFNGSFLF